MGIFGHLNKKTKFKKVDWYIGLIEGKEKSLIQAGSSFHQTITQKQILAQDHYKYLNLISNQTPESVEAEVCYYSIRKEYLEECAEVYKEQIETHKIELLRLGHSLREAYSNKTTLQTKYPLLYPPLYDKVEVQLNQQKLNWYLRKVSLIQPGVTIYNSCPEQFLNFDKFAQKVKDWEKMHAELH